VKSKASWPDMSTYERLMREVVPAPSASRNYQQTADLYLRRVWPMVRRYGQSEIMRLSWRKSQVFNDHKYLVAVVRDDSMVLRDALAAAMPAMQRGGVQEPPLVVIPESESRSTSKRFRPVLEHEFVHMNQMINGNYVALRGKTVKELHEMFLNNALMEFQAYFLVYGRWPDKWMERWRVEKDLSFEHVCFLRGVTQALEHTLFRAIYSELGEAEFVALMDGFPTLIPRAIQQCGVLEEIEPELLAVFGEYVGISLDVLQERDPGIREKPTLVVLANWFQEWREEGERF